jgi:hypothetical protein
LYFTIHANGVKTWNSPAQGVEKQKNLGEVRQLTNCGWNSASKAIVLQPPEQQTETNFGWAHLALLTVS